MAHYWKALIVTQSNVLQNVEVETPGPYRQDAIAQVKSMYGAKEVKFCNPIVKSSYTVYNNPSSNTSNNTSEVSIAAFLIVLILFAIYAFRWIILTAIIVAVLYALYKLVMQ